MLSVSGAYGGGIPVHLPGPLFGILFYLFSLFSEELRSRGERERKREGGSLGEDERQR